jgi:hypothetical protein
MLIFLFPGAMLMQHCLAKHKCCSQQQAPALHEALLPAQASDEPAIPMTGAVQVEPNAVQPYRMWLFWIGALFVLVSILMAALAVATTLHPLPT